MSTQQYTKNDCIEALEKAARQLGKSPTHKEYTSLDISPSTCFIKNKFGSWNEAKRSASLSTQQYTKDDCIEALEKAARQLGKSPTHKEYTSLDISPSASFIRDKFGSWNEAKRAASMDEFTFLESGPSIDEVPDDAPFTQEEWEQLTNDRRTIWRKRMYVEGLKDSCIECGFDKSVHALDFHHVEPENKTKTVSQLVQDGYSYKQIDKEIEKCELLCANCHRIKEHSR